MYKKMLLLYILLGIILTGCTAEPSHSPYPYPITTSPAQQVITRPLSSSWVLVGNPRFSGPAYLLEIHAIQLCPQAIFLVYSLSGLSSARLVEIADMQIVDDQGNGSLLNEALPLGRIGPLELGVMSFQHRKIPSRELTLRLASKSGNVDILEAVIARLEGLTVPLRDRLFSIYSAAQEKDATLEGYTLVFDGWWISSYVQDPNRPSMQEAAPPETDEAAEIAEGRPRPTETAATRKPWAETPPGVLVTDQFTLRIENIETGEGSYLAVQLLSDGKALGILDGVVVQPEPVLGPPTPTPPGTYPVPYGIHFQLVPQHFIIV